MSYLDETSQRKYLRNLQELRKKNCVSEKTIEVLYYSIFEEYYRNKLYSKNIGIATYSNPFLCDGLFTITTIEETYSLLIEAKTEISKPERVLAQTIYYLKTFKDNDTLIPAVICLIDKNSIIVYRTEDCSHLLELDADWKRAASSGFIEKDILKHVSNIAKKGKKFNENIDYNEVLNYISEIGETSIYREVKKKLYKNEKDFDYFLSKIQLEEWIYSGPANAWFHFEENLWKEKDDYCFNEDLLNKLKQRDFFPRLNITDRIEYIKEYLKKTHFTSTNLRNFNGLLVCGSTQINAKTLEENNISKNSLIPHEVSKVVLKTEDNLTEEKIFASYILGSSLDNLTYKEKSIILIEGENGKLTKIEEEFLKQHYSKKVLLDYEVSKFNSNIWIRKSFNNDFALVRIHNNINCEELLNLKKTLESCMNWNKLIIVLTEKVENIIFPTEEFFNELLLFKAEDCLDIALVSGYSKWINRLESNIPESILNNIDSWRDNNDLFRSWIRTEMSYESWSVVLVEDARLAFNQFLSSRGNAPVTQRHFIEMLTNHSEYYDNGLLYKPNARITQEMKRSIPNHIINHTPRREVKTSIAYIQGLRFN